MNILINLILILYLYTYYEKPFPLGKNGSKIILKEVFTINNEDIGSINNIEIDSKEHIYISDGINQCIHLFSKDGKFICKIGGKGEAPGEFKYIWGFGITIGDTLIVYDGIQYRITVYAPERFSSPFRIIRLPQIENKPEMPGVIGTLYSGISGLWLPNINSSVFLVIYNTSYSMNNLKKKHYSKLYKIDNNGNLTEKEALLKIEDVERLKIGFGEKFMVMDMPFGRKPVIRVDQDGDIYYAQTNDFKIIRFTKDGKIKNKINYQVDKKYIKEKLWQMELNKYNNLTLKDIKKSVTPLPKYLPIFEDFTIDDNKNIWVAVNGEDYKTYKYYIFNKYGKLVDIVPLSSKTVIKIISNNYAYGIRTDDSGVQSIVKYKIM